MRNEQTRGISPFNPVTARAVLLGACLLAAAFLAIFAPSALAARGHIYLGQTIGEPCTVEPCTGAHLKTPTAVAVDEASGDIYVLDQGNAAEPSGRVVRFSSAGAFLSEFDGSGTLTGEEHAAGSLGRPEEVESGRLDYTGEAAFPENAEASGLAVDNACHLHAPPLTGSACEAFDPSSGDVYVIDPQGLKEPVSEHRPVVDKYSPSGAYLGQITRDVTGEEFSESGFRRLFGVAIDPRGEVWVYHQNFGSAPRRAANYTNAQPNLRIASRAAQVFGVRPLLAVDSTHHLYLGAEGFSLGDHIAQLPETGGLPGSEKEEIERAFGQPPASGVAVEAGTDDVYVDNQTAIRRYSSEEREFETLQVPGEHGVGLAVGAEGNRASTVYAVDAQADLVYVYPPEPPGPPTVEDDSILEVTATGAKLQGEINPRSESFEEATHYRFEYLTQAEWEANGGSFAGPDAPALTPLPDGSLAANYEVDPVSASLQGLAPATAYRFRLAARNSKSPPSTYALGPERTFTTQTLAASGLPDGRGWELVSPAEKHGSLLFPIGPGLVQASASGDAISYLANGPTEAAPAGFSESVQLLSRRAGGASAPWQSQDISTPHSGAVGIGLGTGGDEYRFFSSDLSRALVTPLGPFTPLSPEATEQTPYLRTDFPPGDPASPCLTACYQPLVSAADVPEGTAFAEKTVAEGGNCASKCAPFFLGASPDLSHVVLESPVAPLLEGAGDHQLYEWSAGRLQLVSQKPAGGPLPAAALPALGYGKFRAYFNARDAISSDGSRVVFSEAEGAHHLYLRDSAAGGGEGATLQLDRNQGGAGTGAVEPIYQDATPDGSRVFFTDTQRLAPGASGSGADLYECRIETTEEGKLACGLHDLTAQGTGEAAGVIGLLAGISEDGSSLYFTADGVLEGTASEGAVPGSCTRNPAVEAQPPGATCNLYLHTGGQTRLVAVLSGEDFPDWALRPGGLGGLTARVSRSGRYLAFMSRRPLSGYDNRDAASGVPDQEVFLYDSQANGGQGRLLCASCDPTGARPHGAELREGQALDLAGGRGVWPQGTWIAANIPGWTPISISEDAALHQSRYLSDSGRLFFNSSDALLLGDSDGTGDVYQWEPPAGEGAPPADTCTASSPTYAPTSGGCLDLISSGTSKEESAFMDASESGKDVFFLTASRLSTRDEDTALDLYDARVGGGEAEAVKPVECSGDACQQPAVPPSDQTPGSLTFEGAGNVTECPKGKIKKHDKCVKQKSKKKHHRKKGHKKSHKRTASHNRGGQK